jgi:leucyl/phenylalanyl-tRNA--protein transferase
MVFLLDNDFKGFPDPRLAESDGLLAMGGDLSPERLLNAYAIGVFPWYNPDEEILWWCPKIRAIYPVGEVKISKSLAQSIRNKGYSWKFDTAFEQVISHCADVFRKGEDGTWISPEMKSAYIELHHLGIAHSVETWYEGELVGGLYGLSLGGCFFGESMFHLKADASKTALVFLSETLKKWNFGFIDAQMSNPHVDRMGAIKISRSKFLKLLEKELKKEHKIGMWEV